MLGSLTPRGTEFTRIYPRICTTIRTVISAANVRKDDRRRGTTWNPLLQMILLIRPAAIILVADKTVPKTRLITPVARLHFGFRPSACGRIWFNRKGRNQIFLVSAKSF